MDFKKGRFTMDTTIQKSYYRFLEDFIKEHLNTLLNVRVFIFGAGVRGCNLLRILKIFNIPDIVFVDNNSQKQGTEIDGCPVLSFPEADCYTNRHIFLCQIENGGQILEQLALTGRRENIDYFNLDFQFTDYLDVIEEIKYPAHDYSLVFGNCILASSILGSKFSPSLGELLKQLFPSYCKICALPGLSSAIYYHIINTSIRIHREVPRFIFLTMEISCFSPYTPLMLGKQNYLQHKLFIERLMEVTPPDNEILEYFQIIEDRLKLSVTRNNPVKSYNTEHSRKRVYKLKYNYDVCEDNESVMYTKKILASMNEKKVPVILYFPPVDYMLAKTVCGEDFPMKYTSIVNSIQSFLVEYSYYCIDASFIADSDCFVQQVNSPDINPWLNEKGQKQLLNFLMTQEAIQPFLIGNNLY